MYNKILKVNFIGILIYKLIIKDNIINAEIDIKVKDVNIRTEGHLRNNILKIDRKKVIDGTSVRN